GIPWQSVYALEVEIDSHKPFVRMSRSGTTCHDVAFKRNGESVLTLYFLEVDEIDVLEVSNSHQVRYEICNGIGGSHGGAIESDNVVFLSKVFQPDSFRTLHTVTQSIKNSNRPRLVLLQFFDYINSGFKEFSALFKDLIFLKQSLLPCFFLSSQSNLPG